MQELSRLGDGTQRIRQCFDSFLDFRRTVFCMVLDIVGRTAEDYFASIATGQPEPEPESAQAWPSLRESNHGIAHTLSENFVEGEDDVVQMGLACLETLECIHQRHWCFRRSSVISKVGRSCHTGLNLGLVTLPPNMLGGTGSIEQRSSRSSSIGTIATNASCSWKFADLSSMHKLPGQPSPTAVAGDLAMVARMMIAAVQRLRAPTSITATAQKSPRGRPQPAKDPRKSCPEGWSPETWSVVKKALDAPTCKGVGYTSAADFRDALEQAASAEEGYFLSHGEAR
jgi:hypothetical protein